MGLACLVGEFLENSTESEQSPAFESGLSHPLLLQRQWEGVRGGEQAGCVRGAGGAGKLCQEERGRVLAQLHKASMCCFFPLHA